MKAIVSNAGTSAVFDGVGRIILSLPSNTFQNADVHLPRPLPTVTLYARYGDYIFGSMLLIGLVIILGYCWVRW